MFYAAHHAYDVCFVNDVGRIYRFDTKRERDAFVNAEPFYDHYHYESVTRDGARHYLPKAFDEFLHKGTSYECENWWTRDQDGNEFWDFWEHDQI